jgi:hypothetical protein
MPLPYDFKHVVAWQIKYLQSSLQGDAAVAGAAAVVVVVGGWPAVAANHSAGWRALLGIAATPKFT